MEYPIEIVALADLAPHPRNYREHPPEQLAQIQASLDEHGFYRNIVIARDGTILAGHGVVEAMRSAGASNVPAIRVDCAPDSPQALRILTGDNQLALFAVDNDALLAGILSEIKTDVAGLLGTGHTSASLDELLAGISTPDPAEEYSRKIEAPVYEMKGERPSEGALYSRERTEKLLRAIDEEEMPEQVRTFLRVAAERHTVFDYGQIAEYYAHAEPAIQELMEQSALVIIDYERAIEAGFVRLTLAMIESRKRDYPGEA